MTTKHNVSALLLLTAALGFSACSDDNSEPANTNESEAAYVGKAVGNFTAEEWLPGGELGTTMSTASSLSCWYSV